MRATMRSRARALRGDAAAHMVLRAASKSGHVALRVYAGDTPTGDTLDYPEAEERQRVDTVVRRF